jgi:hypothetical protein
VFSSFAGGWVRSPAIPFFSFSRENRPKKRKPFRNGPEGHHSFGQIVGRMRLTENKRGPIGLYEFSYHKLRRSEVDHFLKKSGRWFVTQTLLFKGGTFISQDISSHKMTAKRKCIRTDRGNSHLADAESRRVGREGGVRVAAGVGGFSRVVASCRGFGRAQRAETRPIIDISCVRSRYQSRTTALETELEEHSAFERGNSSIREKAGANSKGDAQVLWGACIAEG